MKAIQNLSGHTIIPYSIHGGKAGKSVPLIRTEDQTKMEEGEYFAIETFGSTGRGRVVENVRAARTYYNCALTLFEIQGEVSHYARAWDAPHVPLR